MNISRTINRQLSPIGIFSQKILSKRFRNAVFYTNFGYLPVFEQQILNFSNTQDNIFLTLYYLTLFIILVKVKIWD